MMRAVLALSCALAGAACSPAATCDAHPSASDADAIDSESVNGSLLLTGNGETKNLIFHAALTDLPELWSSDQLIQNGTLPLTFILGYETTPTGFDGRTEMPRLAVTLDSRAASPQRESITSSFPGPAPLQFAPSLFDDCAIGSQHCTSTLAVRIERREGAPFPPVRLTWRALASARIASCALLASASRLSLEVEAP